MSTQRPPRQTPPIAPRQDGAQGCLTIILRILCWILTLLCRLLGRFIPGLCTLRDQVCARIAQPPTTALTKPTDCTSGTHVDLTDPSSGVHTYAYLVEIRGKAFGGSFTGYKLGYRPGTSGAFLENDAHIVYPNTQTNADLGAGLVPTPVGSAIADGTLGYLNALYLTEGHYQIRLRAESGGTPRLLDFDLNRQYIEISEVSSMAVPNSADDTSQLPNAAGGSIRAYGSADTGGCADRRVERFQLEFAPDHLSLAAIIALPPAARTTIANVDYTTDPVFTTMPRPRLGELTISIFKSTCFFLGIPYDCGKTTSQPWATISGPIDRFNVAGLNGKYTMLLTVAFSDATTAHESQQVWVDNRVPVAWISTIEQNQNGTWVDVSGCDPISKAQGSMLRLVGVALDPLILPAEPATAPNLNYASYQLAYSQDGLSTFTSLPAASGGPVGAVDIDATGKTGVGAAPVQPPIISAAEVLGEWDISSLEPCAYVVRLSVTDTTVVNSSLGSTHYSEFLYALCIAA